MIRIAVCDDDRTELNRARVLLDQYCEERQREIACTFFQSPLDLLAEVERGTRFDILFLDVLMPGQNGMEAAKELRQMDENVKIIFMTSSPEFAVESYTVNAYFYQLKPIWKESFFHIMDAVLETCAVEQVQGLVLRCKTGIVRVEPRKIEYCEVIHRTLLLHLTSGRTLETNGTLEDLSAQLRPYGRFLRPHRSFLVNMDYVQKISARAITMRCLTEIPIPRGRYNEIKNEFLEYAFQKGEVPR